MLELFETPVTVLHVLACLLLVLVVLIQPGKSGGLGAALGGAGAQQIFGGRGAGNLLTKVTWISASVFFLTSITLAYVATSTGDSLQDLALEGADAIEAVAKPAEPTTSNGSASDGEPAEGSPSEGSDDSAQGSSDDAE